MEKALVENKKSKLITFYRMHNVLAALLCRQSFVWL